MFIRTKSINQNHRDIVLATCMVGGLDEVLTGLLGVGCGAENGGDVRVSGNRVNCAPLWIPFLPRMSRICADKSRDRAPPGNAEPQLGGFHSGFRADKKPNRLRKV
jgi:hypothetical protein